MTYVCFVRHGETNWNLQRRIQGRTDIQLNALGQQQALLAGLHLKREHWDVLISSPLRRAEQTAQIIANEIEIPHFHIWKEFQERDYGRATGMYIEDFTKLGHTKSRIEGYEDTTHLKNRILLGLKGLAQQYPHQKIIVVTHGVTIMTIINAIKPNEIGNNIYFLKNGSLNFFQHTKKWSILQYNLTEHLDFI